jgi:gentisate 1,2-dioxygenase
MLIRPGEPITQHRRSASAVFHVVEGAGTAVIDGMTLCFEEADTIAVPTHADVKLEASGGKPAYLFQVDDVPLQQKLGIFESFVESAPR